MVKGDTDEKVRTFVKNGGRFLTTFFSGYVQENDLVVLGGYPGKLRDILGIWVEEEDALPQGGANGFTYNGTQYPATLLCDLLHLEGAQQMDEGGYAADFYRGMPVLTKHTFGDGLAYYVATASSGAFYRAFLKDICDEAGVFPLLNAPKGVEVTCREKDGKRWLFVLNHNEDAVELTVDFSAIDVITGNAVSAGVLTLQGRGVLILESAVSN